MGTNKCGTTANQTAMCQNAYREWTSLSGLVRVVPCIDLYYVVNSLDDFCLFAPPQPGKDSGIGSTEV